MMHYPQPSLRTKLILSFLIVIVIGGLISLAVGQRLVRNVLIGQAQAKVNHDLASAWMVFDEKLNDIKDIASLTAARESLQEAIKNDHRDLLLRYLNRVRNQYGLDILTLTDSQGTAIVRPRNPEVTGDSQAQDEIVRQALQPNIVASPEIVAPSELLKEGNDLDERAHLEFIPTPKAAP